MRRLLADDKIRSAAVALGVLGQARLADFSVLAAACRCSRAEFGAAVDALVAAHVIVADPDGTLRFAVPAVANALAEQTDAAFGLHLHAELAARLRTSGQLVALRPQAELAEHVLAGLQEMSDPHPELLVLDIADRLDDGHQTTVATWYQQVLRRLPADDRRWPQTVRRTLRLLHYQGRHTELTQLGPICAEKMVRDRCGAGELDPDLYAEVLLYWALALVFEDRYDQLGVLAALADNLATVVDPSVAPLAKCLADLADARIPTVKCSSAWPWHHPVAWPLALVVSTSVGEAWNRQGHPVRALLEQRRAEHGTARAADLFEALTDGDVCVLWKAFGGAPTSAPTSSTVVAPLLHELRVAARAGRCDDAIDIARQLELRLIDVPDSRVLRTSRAIAAEIHSRRADVRRAADWIALTDDRPVSGPAHAAIRCRVNAAAGHPEDAFVTGTRDVALLLHQGSKVGVSALLDCLVELAVELSRTAELESLLGQLRELAKSTGDPRAELSWRTAQARVLRDADLAERALDLAREIGHPCQVARCCLLLGTFGPNPQPVLREAQELYRELGSVRGRAQVAAVMRDRGIAVPRRRRRATSLSGNERMVAALASEGLTNRQIAGRLGFSEKTVEGDLTRLFAKTGCRSRIELTTGGQLDGYLAAVS